MNWNLLSKKEPKTNEEILSILLKNRGITDKESFLHPKDPIDLTLEDVGIDKEQVNKAVERLKEALENKEKIIIFGDYDCDGVCATTVLWETMHNIGFSVLPFIPDRKEHGYGLSTKALDEILAKNKPSILISVDNGIVAEAQWQRLADVGVFTILTDHHEPEDKLPPADCIIHTTKLCGTTVAWMLARELAKIPKSKIQASKNIEDLLDLCAIATIADQVILTDANRSFVKFGLEQLQKTRRIGLQLLIEAAGLKGKPVDTYAVNFAIAPRINAMGRLGNALDALRALCTKDRSKAAVLIGKLHDTNITRQDLTTQMYEIALAKRQTWKEESVIIVASDQFHEGVIGLIASRLTEMFYKPSIVLAISGETAKGSARSVAGVHITNLLREVKSDLMEIGGHPMAAGLKLQTAQIEVFSQKLRQHAKNTIDVSLLTALIDVDSVLPTTLQTMEVAQGLTVMQPFGPGNREPLFQMDKVKIDSAKIIGKEGKHLKLRTADCDLLWFGHGRELEHFSNSPTVSLIGHLQVNHWNGSKSLQIIVKDIH
ncbi:MAG TPA: single-stranded-DNA-specific exonuclease RecJ [Patescibacteria group bacterium]|nr:single-stranded-DNA-specific exonuclease RecJ [Patescibacteria group bacterium]